jgi:hypothetical protein
MSGAQIAGLLADETRLRVFAAVALGARTTSGIADTTELSLERVQSALSRLLAAGLVEQRDGLRVSASTFQDAARDRPERDRSLPGATDEQAKVLRNFVENGRLKLVPARAGQRRVVLEYLAQLFDPAVEYQEQDVNRTLQTLHPDYASLRRYLVDEGLLERRSGVYKRS